MKRFYIKYEDHSGFVYCVELQAYDVWSALSQINYKEIYWVK